MSSGWQIYDIVAENISVVSNYRQQIDDHFRKGDGAGLVARLEELLKQDEINDDTKI
jgi:ABC-type transporter MlaC component